MGARTADRRTGTIERGDSDGRSSSEEGGENDEEMEDARESDHRMTRSGGLTRSARKRLRKEKDDYDDQEEEEDEELAFSSAYLTQRGGKSDSVVANDCNKTSQVVSRDPEYFPLNAGALRSSVEVIPGRELCAFRRLPPLLKLVTERQGDDI